MAQSRKAFVFVIDDPLQPNRATGNKNAGPWWKLGAEIFSLISTWIIVPIIAAVVAGKALDQKFGTEHKIFLSLAGFGFLVTCFGILRVIKIYNKRIKDLDKK